MDYETKGYDTSIVYDYKEYQDVHYGRCDSVKDGIFLCECRHCGLKKNI
ncbi:hypothetical protein [Bacillus paralicheniformis]|nr:hypothetical protein [Bacillus paralicheniformis]MEC1021921.1 hypothetical protein [Bacillus paralicheniformis]MEC1025258.1 hypothetical protein [Bacillus paralicheniformis]MEC1036035.1 hypothetical protein [Bacillus paralicheniformis]MEC1052751.1 hypothetical protein [Bacillus paralicheniformis]MEC1061732.1 hypothetical protein [Bacillus paralicheniformis]